MPADAVITRDGPVAVPMDYQVPTGTEIRPRVLSAKLDGSGAGGAFVPVLEVIAPNGHVTAYCARQVQIAAGASVLVSWFPGVAEADVNTSSSSSSGTVSSITSPQGTLSVNNPSGPTVNIDLPLTGVAAGSYGDGSHVPAVTVDAEGRLSSVTAVPISGGSGTIGFEINYTEKTSATFITSTNPAAPTTILSPGAITFDGGPVLVTFFSGDVRPPNFSGEQISICLYEGATEVARIAFFETNSATQPILSILGQYRFTPTAGSHTYTIGAFVSTNSGSPFVDGGPGGAGNPPPCFVRFTKV